MEVEIPWTMATLMTVGDLFRSIEFWIGILIVISAIALTYFIGIHFTGFRLLRDRFLIRCPFVHRLVKQKVVANFAHVFATMLRAGVPLPESLQAARNTTKNEVVRLAVDRTQEAVQEGGRIVPPLERENVFPPLAYEMMEVGEETGELGHVFRRIAEIYEERAANNLEILGKLIHPAVIIVLAIIVGFVVIAMFHTYATLLVEATGNGV
jgi:type IV pilus assembly protein PilC